MTKAQQEMRYRLKIFEEAALYGNISFVCRKYGISRDSYYRWKQQYQSFGEKGLVTAERKNYANTLIRLGLSIVKACVLTGIDWVSYYRLQRDWRQADSVVVDAINAVLKKSPKAGFWKCYGRIRLAGYAFNHKRVYRVYCQMGLNLPKRSKRVLPKQIA